MEKIFFTPAKKLNLACAKYFVAFAKQTMVLANQIKYQKFTWCYVRETYPGSMIYCVVFADNDGNEMFSYGEFTFEEAELLADEFNLS